MAYSSLNAPFIVAPAVASGANRTTQGGNIWVYRSPDTLASVVAANYFADGFTDGMQVADVVIVVDTTTPAVAYGVVTSVANGHGATITATMNNATATQFVATESITGAASQGAFAYGTLPYADTGIVASYDGVFNSYIQQIMQNCSTGTVASADYCVGNNLGTSAAYYGDFGISGTGYTTGGAGNLYAANMTYLYSANCDLAVGTISTNAVHFVVNGSSADALTLSSSLNAPSASKYAVGGVQVVGAQVPGYGTPTGGAYQVSFASSTITTTGIASALAQLITDLQSHGLISS